MRAELPREKHPVFVMKMVTDRAETLFRKRVGELEVTAPQCRVLMYLETCGGRGVSQRELEKYLEVSHTTVKGLLQRLEEKGYVRTAFDGRDGRVKHAYLTEEFQRMREETRHALAAFESHLVAGFSEEELQTLRQMLERMYRNTLTPGPEAPQTKNQ